MRDGVCDFLRVNSAAVFQDEFVLIFVEIDFFNFGDCDAVFIDAEPFHGLAFFDGQFYYIVDVFGFYAAVEIVGGLDENGIALRGLLVRHLVLPEGTAGTAEIARFLVEEISRDTYINVMDQYRPCYKAAELPPLDRPITRAEYKQAVQQAREAGLHRFDEREPRFLRLL